jgi:two-component system, chemotaxis family, chemotaxis protein CheY
MKVLVVDDSSIMRMMVRNLLCQITPAETIEADNGKKALEILIDEKVDLVLMDVHMPEMDGLQLLRTMKALPAVAHIPVIVVSSDTEMKQIDEARKLGACSYVTKPFRKEALQDALKVALPEK